MIQTINRYTICFLLVPLVCWVCFMAWFGIALLNIILFLILLLGFFFFPGLGILTLFSLGSMSGAFILAGCLGLGISTTLYALAKWQDVLAIFFIPIIILASLGLKTVWKRIVDRASFNGIELSKLMGTIYLFGWGALLIIGGAMFFSGHMEGENLVYYGHLGRDPVFHLAMIGQLHWAVPPENFIVSGYPFSYHFFTNLSQSLLLDMSGGTLDLNNMYYRLYPSFIYFLLGSSVTMVCVQLFHSIKVAAFATVLLIGGANFSLFPGLGQSLMNIGDLGAFLQRLFTPWDGWSVAGGAVPLIHRPSYYHGMLFLFSGIKVLTEVDCKYKHWILAGVIWGTMAGFNFTLAASIGLCLGGVIIVSMIQRNYKAGALLLACAGSIFVLSVPFITILYSSMSGVSSGTLPDVEPGYIALAKYGYLLNETIPNMISVLLLTLVMMVIAFGIKLFGLPNMIHQKLGYTSNNQLILFTIFLFSFNLIMALFFRWNQAYQVSAIIFIQPSTWLLGLFAVMPVYSWMETGSLARYRKIIVWLLLLTPLLQGLVSMNLSYKTVVSYKELEALEYIKSHAFENDVIAFFPTSRKTEPIFVPGASVHNFFISALTGLRGYVSSDSYSIMQVQRSPDGIIDYRRRAKLIQDVMLSKASQNTVDDLISDGVRWILLPIRVTLNGLSKINIVKINSDYSVLTLSPE